jgi:hypothetical protein
MEKVKSRRIFFLVDNFHFPLKFHQTNEKNRIKKLNFNSIFHIEVAENLFKVEM